MAGLTLAEAQANLAAWNKASLSVAEGQEFQINGKTWKSASPDEVLRQIKYWEDKVKSLTNGGRSIAAPASFG